MRLTVTGCGERLKSEIEDATLFFISELVPDHLRDGIKYVKIVAEPRKRLNGCCGTIKSDPTRFRIMVASNQSKINFLKHLAHECVHLKQFFLGELIDLHPQHTPNDQQVTYWRYRRHYLKKWEYQDHPWEQEASELQEKLYTKYARSRGLT